MLKSFTYSSLLSRYCVFLTFIFAVTLPGISTAQLIDATDVKTPEENISYFTLRPPYIGASASIPKSYLPQMYKFINALKKVQLSHISVTGHSNPTPLSPQSRHIYSSNFELSLARARNIAELISQETKLDKNNIVVKGFGAAEPLTDNTTSEGQHYNRRIEITVKTHGQQMSLLPGLSSTDTVPDLATKMTTPSPAGKKGKVSLSLRNTDIVEVMDMLSRKERVNILLSKDVKAVVSVNLYDVDLDNAIKAIASSAGYVVEIRHGSYYIINREEAGKFANSNNTQLRTFKVQYTEPKAVETILKNHLSNYGKITVLAERSLLVIEDTPEFISRIEKLLTEIDKKPKQILIEAKILEVTLEDNETFGLNWKRLFNNDGGSGSFGATGLASPGSAGFFLDLVTPNLELALSALNTEGRVRTLSTPKLLALENQEASVVIGDRIGYRLTTTINQVTTESIKFLESGIILKVQPSIDNQDRILLNIHPEVSTGTVTAGVPSQKTTEVSTQLLVNDGQTVFIGGLLKRTVSEGRDSVPILGSIPLIGGLFSSDKQLSTNTETVVMITPHIIINSDVDWQKRKLDKIRQAEKELKENARTIESKINLSRGSLPGSKTLPGAAEHTNSTDLSTSWNIPDENIW